MKLRNRRVRVEIQKTVQEIQFEPLKVVIAVEGDIPDDASLKEEIDELSIFVENSIYDQLERMTSE